MDFGKRQRRWDTAVSFGRRGGIAAVAVTLVFLAGMLAACASSPAASTARQMMFSPSLGDDYRAAAAVMEEEADDAKLLAIRSSSCATGATTPSWMYLFYSWDKAQAYTVFVVNGEASLGETGNLPLTPDDFAAVPDVDALAFDADAAYERVLEAIEGEEEFSTCRAYLMTYVKGDDDPTADALKWFFVFNDPDDIGAVGIEGNQGGNGGSTESLVYAVDAQTGDVVNCGA